jgi:uncharacterized phage protein (TIGR01671 family)
MREIKFRAWDKTRQIMFVPIGYSYIDGYLTCISEAKRTMQNDVTEHLDETWYEDYREPRYSDGKSEIILMQYTGLKDKNGKEIYEGDIVQSIDWGQPKRARAMVIFEGYEWKTVPKNRGSHKTAYDLWSQVWGKEGEFVEVIGNIHENPELLEEDSE